MIDWPLPNIVYNQMTLFKIINLLEVTKPNYFDLFETHKIIVRFHFVL